MDREEARRILNRKLETYRSLAYDDLRARVGSLDVQAVEGADGSVYQIEIQVHWDGKPGGDIRVLGAIDDGGWSAFAPLSEDFIVTGSAGA